METPNLNYLKELSGGDVAFEESIVVVIKKEFPLEYANFLVNFKNENFIEAANNVHKLKHKIGILGLNKGVEVASSFEAALRKGKTELYEDFIEVLNKIHVYLGLKK